MSTVPVIQKDSLPVKKQVEKSKSTNVLTFLYKYTGLKYIYMFIKRILTIIKEIKNTLNQAIEQDNPLQPIRDLMNVHQIRTILLAWIPVRFGSKINTGVFSVDMFLTTTLVTCLTAAGSVTTNFIKFLWNRNSKEQDNDQLTIQVNYHRYSHWGYKCLNPHYTALLWLISRLSSDQKKGDYRMIVSNDRISTEVMKSHISKNPINTNDNLLKKVTNDFNANEVAEDCEHLDFNLLPRDDSTIEINHEGETYLVWFDQPANTNEDGSRTTKVELLHAEPTMFVRRKKSENDTENDTNVAKMYDWLLKVSRLYDRYLANSDELKRYEYEDENGWTVANTLHISRGLDCLCLDKAQGMLLRQDLDNFMKDKDFYSRMGIPYRRGYLLSGKPGTGKSSLINAISASYKRDLYYINLKDIKDDPGLQSAFSGVKKNSIVVLEDVDAQSRIVHKRSDGNFFEQLMKAMTSDDSKKDKKKEKKEEKEVDTEEGSSTDEKKKDDDAESKDKDNEPSGSGLLGPSMMGPSLSALLNCMDGYTLNEGVMIIMTSNHPDVLDPALIRPGRIDLHLELGYCTHYQIQSMFNLVMNKKANVEEIEICDKEPSNEESENTSDDETMSISTDPAENTLLLDLSGIPEHCLPPCDAMRIILLYRTESPEFISKKLKERAMELKSGKAVGDAMTCKLEEPTVTELSV
ncbi:hypothetical protein BC833DRAFT_600900 [Globomyces pollinis-pini]|nr:hypothetical protein BC833DRAFT_600900 [Globomyces pollinis-pini]